MKQELEEVVKQSWAAITNNYLAKLVNSMLNWCMDVIANGGSKIDY